MHIHDEDDSPDLFHHSRDDSRDDDADEEQTITHDDFATVRCTRCRKLIFEDTEQCPYCKHYQMEDERNRKAPWFIAGTVLCIVAVLIWILTRM